MDSEIKQFSQELQLDGTYGKFDWLVGGYYYNMKQDQKYWPFGSPYVWPSAPFPPASFFISFLGILPPELITNVSFKATTYATFSNLSYRLSDQWKLSAGVRYSYEEKEMLADTPPGTGT